MTVATVTTDINIGPFKIPSNAQNMIMNNYAERNKLSVEVVIPEPIMSNQLATTQWLCKDFKFTKIILCSIHQLPKNSKIIDEIIEILGNVEFHFAIEGLKGSGKEFLINCIEESKIFENAKKIDSQKYDWLKLHSLMQTNNRNSI